MKSATLGTLLRHAGTLSLILGALAGSAEVLACGCLAVGFGYFLRDYVHRSSGSVNAMSVYMLFSGLWFGLGNLAGYLAVGSSYEEKFPSWRVDEFLFEAQLLGAVAVVVPPIVYDWASSSRGGSLMRAIRQVGFEVPDRIVLRFVTALLAVSWVFRVAALDVRALGTLGSLVALGPNLAIFILSLMALGGGPATPTPWWSPRLPLLVTAIEVAYQLTFTYMRSHVVWPVLSFLLPYLLCKKLTRRVMTLGVVVAVGFVLLLDPLAQLRGERVYGRSRLDRLVSETHLDAPSVQSGTMALLARLSTSSQLSQVVRLVHEDGFLGGETMRWLGFVFIPRVIWPEKPNIVPGQWFAERLGRGTRFSADQFSNAINMTIPGELFLNFGWLGAILGLGLVGYLYRVLWDSTRFHTERGNPIGQVFAYVLLTQAMTVGGHVGAILNVVLWYILSLVLTLGLPFVAGRLVRRHGPVVSIHAQRRAVLR